MAGLASRHLFSTLKLISSLRSASVTCAFGLAIALPLAATTPARAFVDGSATASTLNFVDADIGSVAVVMAAILHRPIAVDPRVKGTLSLYTEQPVGPTQAYAMFVASLRGLGYAVVSNQGLLAIVPETDAKLLAGYSGRRNVRTGPGNEVDTQVFRLAHESAANLVGVLRPLISPNNTINVNSGSNALVITDYADNLVRLGRLIATLDVPSATDVEVIPLHHGTAANLAATVLRLIDNPAPAATANGAGGAAPATSTGAATHAASIVADPNLNALLVRAPSAAQLDSIRALVARLDQPGASSGNIHVVYLKYAEATRLATVLRSATANDAGKPATAPGGSSGGGGAAAPASAGAAVASMGSSASGTSSTTATPVSATSQPTTGGYIQADPATNSLIITAPEPAYREMLAAIELLDTRRAQLYVESLVVEVDATRAIDVGLQWKQIFSISQSTLSTTTLGDIAEALQSMAGTNILSTANVVTLDNEEAQIVVGQNVPFVTGSYATTGSNTASPFQTVERKDVGVTLRIRPQIGPDGNIRMKIMQESSSVSATTTPGTSNAGPATNKRSIESTVLVNDGKIIVLGGLIEDSYESEAGQVPGLSEIPYVGALFRYFTRTRKKTNLVVFLRPHVLSDEASTTALSLDRYDVIRARQAEHPKDVRQVLPEDDMPVLPAEPARR